MTAPEATDPTPGEVRLSEAEREALGLIVVEFDNDDQSLTEWHPCANCPGGPCPCSGRPWLHSRMTEAVERIVAARLAARDNDATAELVVADALAEVAELRAKVERVEALADLLWCDEPSRHMNEALHRVACPSCDHARRIRAALGGEHA